MLEREMKENFPHAKLTHFLRTGTKSDTKKSKKVEIKNSTVYVSGYTETPDSRGR
jgi:hypothetical protein